MSHFHVTRGIKCLSSLVEELELLPTQAVRNNKETVFQYIQAPQRVLRYWLSHVLLRGY